MRVSLKKKVGKNQAYKFAVRQGESVLFDETDNAGLDSKISYVGKESKGADN